MLLKTYSSNSEAGCAESRRLEQTSSGVPLPTYAFMGLTKNAKNSLTEGYSQTGWSCPSSLHQYLPISNILLVCMTLWWSTLLSRQIQLKTYLAKIHFPHQDTPQVQPPVQLHTHKATGPDGRAPEDKDLSLQPHQLVLTAEVQPLKCCKIWKIQLTKLLGLRLLDYLN